MNRTPSGIEWKRIRGVVFDVDGTLYRQQPVRIRMAIKLVVHVLMKRRGWLDVLVLRHFRRNREFLADVRAPNVSEIQFKATAQAYRMPEEQVAAIVHEWMELRPLSSVSKARYKDIDQMFDTLRNRGVAIGVFSDYPAAEKLKALNLKADVLCISTAKEVNRLKPEPAGLIRTVEMLGLTPSDCVMIGDRMERDGQCAERAAVQFIQCKGADFYTYLLVDFGRS